MKLPTPSMTPLSRALRLRETNSYCDHQDKSHRRTRVLFISRRISWSQTYPDLARKSPNRYKIPTSSIASPLSGSPRANPRKRSHFCWFQLLPLSRSRFGSQLLRIYSNRWRWSLSRSSRLRRRRRTRRRRAEDRRRRAAASMRSRGSGRCPSPWTFLLRRRWLLFYIVQISVVLVLILYRLSSFCGGDLGILGWCGSLVDYMGKWFHLDAILILILVTYFIWVIWICAGLRSKIISLDVWLYLCF